MLTKVEVSVSEGDWKILCALVSQKNTSNFNFQQAVDDLVINVVALRKRWSQFRNTDEGQRWLPISRVRQALLLRGKEHSQQKGHHEGKHYSEGKTTCQEKAQKDRVGRF